jgi:hypothetical protein
MRQNKVEKETIFPTELSDNEVTRAEALVAFEEMRKQAADVPEMTLDEINKEIHQIRED